MGGWEDVPVDFAFNDKGDSSHLLQSGAGGAHLEGEVGLKRGLEDEAGAFVDAVG